jgi:hypothetical protein
MQLEIQLLLRLHGLPHVKDYLKLEVKEKGNLVLLKYNTLAADWSKSALYDCRGIILDKEDDWKVVAYPYKKFFNVGEGYAAKIDWSNAVVYEKEDGSLMTFWYYKGEWRLSTSGTIDADTTSNGGEFTFAELAWNSAIAMYGSKEAFLVKLNPQYNYMFELCTPWNIVVTQHQTSRLVLHGIRDMKTFKELHLHDTGLVSVKVYDLKDEDAIRETFTGENARGWQEEGYVAMDKHTMEKVKMKNPAYVSVHHVKSGVSPYEIMSVIKSNEISEFCVYFKERTEFINMLNDLWIELETRLENIWKVELNCGVFDTQKEFALKVLNNVERPFHGIMFNMKKGINAENEKKKVGITNIREGLCELENRFLYKYLQGESI